jgi:hypothetical protein
VCRKSDQKIRPISPRYRRPISTENDDPLGFILIGNEMKSFDLNVDKILENWAIA